VCARILFCTLRRISCSIGHGHRWGLCDACLLRREKLKRIQGATCTETIPGAKCGSLWTCVAHAHMCAQSAWSAEASRNAATREWFESAATATANVVHVVLNVNTHKRGRNSSRPCSSLCGSTVESPHRQTAQRRCVSSPHDVTWSFTIRTYAQRYTLDMSPVALAQISATTAGGHA
jgi:hypothetical protein